MNKGEQTKRNILFKAMEHASTHGISQVTIGKVAKACDMSRTGVISHFKNKEDMQLAILKYAQDEYIENVVKKSYDEDPYTYIQQYFETWIGWTERLNFGNSSSCPFFKALVEHQDQDESAVKVFAVDMHKRLLAHFAKLAQKCVDAGSFKKDTDTEEFAFRVFALYTGHSVSKNLHSPKRHRELVSRAFSKLLADYSV